MILSLQWEECECVQTMTHPSNHCFVFSLRVRISQAYHLPVDATPAQVSAHNGQTFQFTPSYGAIPTIISVRVGIVLTKQQADAPGWI